MTETVIDLECDNVILASEMLGAENIFSETAIFGSKIHLVTQTPDEAMSLARKVLEEAALKVFRMEVITPSLEDVFVTLTSPRSRKRK